MKGLFSTAILLSLFTIRVADSKSFKSIQRVQVSLDSPKKLWQRRYKYDVVEVISSRDKACREIIDIYLFSQEIRQALKEKAAGSTLALLSAQFLYKMTSLQTYLEFFTRDSEDLREPCPLPGNEHLINNRSCSNDTSAPGCLHCVTYKTIPSASDLDFSCLWLLRDFQETQKYLMSMNTSVTSQGSTTNVTSAPTDIHAKRTISSANTSAAGTSLTSTEQQSSLKVTRIPVGGSVASATALESTSWVNIITEGSESSISERTKGLLSTAQLISSSTSFSSPGQQTKLETGGSMSIFTSTSTEDIRSFVRSTLKERSPSTAMTNSGLSSNQPASTPQSLRYISILNCSSKMVLPENEARVRLLEFSNAFEHDLLVLEEGQVFLPEMKQLLLFLHKMWEPLSRKRRRKRNKVKRYAINFRSDQLQLSESVECDLNRYDDPKYLMYSLEESILMWGEKLTDVDRLFFVACYLARVTSATNDETIRKGVWIRTRDAGVGQQIKTILDSVSTYEGKIGALQVRTEEAKLNVTEALKDRSLVVKACV